MLRRVFLPGFKNSKYNPINSEKDKDFIFNFLLFKIKKLKFPFFLENRG